MQTSKVKASKGGSWFESSQACCTVYIGRFNNKRFYPYLAYSPPSLESYLLIIESSAYQVEFQEELLRCLLFARKKVYINTIATHGL